MSCRSVYVTLGYRRLLSAHTLRHTYSPLCLRPRRICDIYDLFAPHINVLTYYLLIGVYMSEHDSGVIINAKYE